MKKAWYTVYSSSGRRRIKAHQFSEAQKRAKKMYQEVTFIMLQTKCPGCGAKIDWNKKDYPIHIIKCPGCTHHFRICTDFERQSCETCKERIDCLTHNPL